MLLHCSYIRNSYKLNTSKMLNNKSYKLNITKMPNNNNEKRDYNTAVSDGAKKF